MSKHFMKCDARFFAILFWETLENAPVLIGFLLAIRVQSENLALSFVYLLAGVALSVGLIHFTEKKKFSNQPTSRETLVNFVIFTIVAVPFVFYFSAYGVWWSNWGTDIVLGAIAGGVLAIGESWGWKNTATVRMHIASMSISAALFLFAIRFIYGIESLIVMLIVSFIFILLISMIIVLFDYWPVNELPPVTVRK